MSSIPTEGLGSHEPRFTEAEVEAARQAVMPFVEAAGPLIEQVRQSTDPRLDVYGTGWSLEPRERLSGKRNEDATVFDSSYYPNDFARSLLRGPAGETLRIHIYHDSGDDDAAPSKVDVVGQSSEGKFELSYNRDYKSGGAECVMPTGNYRVGFNLTNYTVGATIAPLPLGQVRLGWSGEDGTAQVTAPGVIALSKDRFEILPNTSYDPRDRNVLDYDEAMDWYENNPRLGRVDRDRTQLEVWIAALSSLKFHDLVDRAKEQAQQALEAVQLVIADPGSGTTMTPAEYYAIKDRKYGIGV